MLEQHLVLVERRVVDSEREAWDGAMRNFGPLRFACRSRRVDDVRQVLRRDAADRTRVRLVVDQWRFFVDEHETTAPAAGGNAATGRSFGDDGAGAGGFPHDPD